MKLFWATLLLTAIACCTWAQDKLPDFRVVNVYGKYVRKADLRSLQPVILIYFQPDCEDCREFTELLMSDDIMIRRYQLLMITNADLKKLKEFVTHFKLTSKKNLLVGTEGWTGIVQRKLAITHFPSVLVYNKNQMLQRKLIGQIDMKKFYLNLKALIRK